MQFKNGFEKILRNIERLKRQDWLEDSQRSWPDYLFHFSDIQNARNILVEELLFSRSELQRKKYIPIDIASPDIIGNTSEKWKEYVRLYFRPRTPMQFSNEGIRSKNEIKYNAHCPVPVVFIFDAKKILPLTLTKFSNGNLAAEGVEVNDSVDFYLKLPFNKIYHNKRLDQLSEGEKRSTIFHRHAEVIVPEKLELSCLKYVLCRSQAEYETLLFLLPEDKRVKWRNRITVDNKSRYFFSNWTYVDKVYLDSSYIILYFNSSYSSFHVRVELEVMKTNKKFYWEKEYFKIGPELKLDLSKLSNPTSYTVSLYLDYCLAYRNIFTEAETEIFL